MTQLIINIEDKSILPHLKKILNALNGVSIAKAKKEPKCALDRSLEEAQNGKVTSYENADELFNAFGI